MIKVNSKDFQWEEKLTVSRLLQKKNYTYPKIIVKVNGKLVHKEEYDEKVIKDGDDVQVIHLLAGG
ncbi:sulfur carrier protein [Anaerosolibacter carboniphilus]|uniref:Sulfur carrier protein n=1 Tax=Anaerosolibacter carboniphilus TaxID=1417629 RepID=A0A841L478_9FIRM|nr:sulfur carrier protein ThiS [Anaerosolibacter carboniphilus]MBB6217189.1 sulfur carrier protein [Anaerosolibacter carboniphilus]